ncbi:uncharacterized protein PAC_02309 [Phialocephala subalpina]|uniref:Uncharacterized protein n=1 Tax=Phialocephala subalpina TaxID=576137 RepID=A0A1L7WI39_9HELO|nr:uncharacterized protein PAC_02309 [Phialocephala subalpina]
MPQSEFRIANMFSYQEKALSEFYRGISTFRDSFIEDGAILALEEFLKFITLVLVQNNLQPLCVANLRRGTILLPFCVQTQNFNEGSLWWPAFHTFLSNLVPLIHSLDSSFGSEHPAEYERANRYLENLRSSQLVGSRIDVRTGCFLSMRLSKNVALDPVPLTSSHSSPWTVVTLAGGYYYTAEKMKIPILQKYPDTPVVYGAPGDILTIRSGVSVGSGTFVGDRYQLENFLLPVTETDEANTEKSNETGGVDCKEESKDSGEGGGKRGSRAGRLATPS